MKETPESSPEGYTRQTRESGPGEQRSPDEQRLEPCPDRKGTPRSPGWRAGADPFRALRGTAGQG